MNCTQISLKAIILKEWASVWIFLSKLLFIVLQRKTTKISFFVLEWKPKKITFFVLKRKKRSFWHVFERNILKTNVLKYSQTIYSILVMSQKTNVPIPSFKHPVMTVGSPKMGIWYLLHRTRHELKGFQSNSTGKRIEKKIFQR